MKIWQILVVSVAAGITLPAVAQMAEGRPATTRAEVEARVKDRLGKMDTNKDGTVTRDEIMASVEARRDARADDRFAAMDTDKNGSISRAEFDAWDAKRGDRMVRIERRGPGTMAAPTAPAPDSKPVVKERTRVMMMGRDGMVMADGDGKGVVIADAVKRALDRFDTVDTDRDGKISPEERKAARGAWRMKGG